MMHINMMRTEEKKAYLAERALYFHTFKNDDLNHISQISVSQHQSSRKGYTYLQSRLLYRNLAVDSRPFWANSPQFLFIEGEKLSSSQHTKAVHSPGVTRNKQEINKKLTAKEEEEVSIYHHLKQSYQIKIKLQATGQLKLIHTCHSQYLLVEANVHTFFSDIYLSINNYEVEIDMFAKTLLFSKSILLF